MMFESENEIGNENTLDWRYCRRNPDYDELNTILDESQAVNRWLRKIKNVKNKLTVLRMCFWWLKSNEPRLYSLGPDGLVRYQRKEKGTDNEYDIPDTIEAWLYDKGGHYNTLRTYRSTIRSFFLHNIVELPIDSTSRLQPTRYSQVTMFEMRALLKETGMRAGEAYRLKWQDIDFEAKLVNVTPEKGSNPRNLRLSNKLLSMIKRL